MSDQDQNPREDRDLPPTEPPGPPPPPPPGAQGSYGTGSAPPPPPPGGQPGGQFGGQFGATPGGWQQPGAMPPPSYQGMPPAAGQPADLWPRFAARLIDFVLLTVVNVVLISFVVVGLIVGSGGGTVTNFGVGDGMNWAANAVSTLLSTAITLGYFSLMEAKRGQTVGKMLLNLETRGPGGGRPTMEQALRRNAFTAIGVLGIIPFFGFIAGLLSLAAVIMIAVTISKDTVARHGWHDDFAGGTTVVKLR